MQISLVRWNEPYQKLATCDASGIIFVWIRYEGRWSIELINDRNRPVSRRGRRSRLRINQLLFQLEKQSLCVYVELKRIHVRSVQVTHFSWSHDGRMAVIAYQVNALILVRLYSLELRRGRTKRRKE